LNSFGMAFRCHAMKQTETQAFIELKKSNKTSAPEAHSWTTIAIICCPIACDC